jgi:SAM-dependent methyltransferase
MPTGGRRCGPIRRRFFWKWASSPAQSRLISVAATGCSRVPLALVAKRVYAVDIDPVMLDRARARVEEARADNCEFVVADAMAVDAVVPEPVDYVFLANTFHGVPDQLGLARGVAASLKPKGLFGIINWHRRPREKTVVFGQPRGPKTGMRIEANEVAAIVKPAGLLLSRTLELPPYHYGVVFSKKGGRNE